MKIAILLYPGFTSLDAIGPYETLVHAPGVEMMLVAKEKKLLTGEVDVFKMMPSHDFSEVDSADILLIPGGPGETPAANDPETVNWIRKIHKTTKYTTSVCTGSLILAKAGLLEGKTATTHWAAAKILEAFGVPYKAERWVEEGKVITAAGVSAGIDMALYLVGKLLSPEVAMSLQLGIEYDPQPPYDSGSVAKADPDIHRNLAAMFAHSMGERQKAITA